MTKNRKIEYSYYVLCAIGGWIAGTYGGLLWVLGACICMGIGGWILDKKLKSYKMNEAYQEGYIAYEDGLWQDSNPYEPSTDKYKDWMEGWYDAENDNS